MRAGASDYRSEPVAPKRLLQALRAATVREAPRVELAPLTEKLGAVLDFHAMIGAAPTSAPRWRWRCLLHSHTD